MKTLLTPNSLCDAILRLRFSELDQENIGCNDLRTMKMEAMTIGQAEYQSIHNELARGTTIPQVLRKYKQEFQFDAKLMESMMKEATLRAHPPQKIVSLVLNSYLSVLLSYSIQQDSSNLILMIRVVAFLSAQEYVMRNKRLIMLFTSAYVHLFATYVDQSGPDDHSMFLQLMSDFFSRVRNVPPPAYELFVRVGKKLIDPNDRVLTKNGSDLVAYFDSVITEAGPDFPKTVAQEIIQMLAGPMSTLDMCSLMLFSHVSSIVGVDFMLSYVPLLPLAIVSAIESQPPTTPYVRAANTPLVVPEATHFAISLRMVEHKTFDEELDLTSKIEFPDRVPLSQMIRPDILMKLQMILKAIGGNKTLCQNMMSLCPRFFDSTAHAEYAYDNFAAFFYIFDQLLQAAQSPDPPLEILCHNTLFDPSITVFDADVENWDRISSLRAMAVDFLLCAGVPGFHFALYHTTQTPLIFAEIVHRFILVQPCLSISRLEIPTVTQTLMFSMITYQLLSDLSDEDRKLVNIARKSLFLFLNNAFTELGLLKLLFRDPFFIESFMALLFEAPVRKVILAPLLKSMTMKDSHDNTALIQKILQIFDIAMESLDREETIKLCRDLLVVINETVILDRQYAGLFESLSSKITRGIIMMPKTPSSQDFIIQYVTFLADISHTHVVDSPETAALEAAIERVHGDEPPQDLFVKVVQLMAGQQLPSLHPSFIINQPKAVKLLLSIFAKSKMIKDVFGFVATLCQHDKRNCLQAHMGEVDILLIEMLQRWRDDSSVELVIIASALSLLMLIMNAVCSASVVQSFVTLFCQIEGRYLPVFHKLTLKSMNKLLVTAKQRPMSFLPLVAESGFDFEGFRGEKLENGFTVAIWVYAQNCPPQYKPQLLILRDIKGQKFCFFMQGSNLMIRIDAPPSQYVGKPDIRIPLDKWSLMTCTFTADTVREQMRVLVALDGQEGRDLFFPLIRLMPGPIVGRIGGTATDSINAPNPLQLGGMGVFKPINHQYISQIVSEGPSSTAVRQYEPFFYFAPNEHDQRVYLRNIVDDTIKTLDDSVPVHHLLTFTDVLVNHCNLDILLPLFAQWDLKFRNGESFQYMPETTIELLENALLLSLELQEQFAMSGGLKAILHLLMSAHEKHITYQLYFRWFSTCCLMKNQLLQEQMFDLILLNPELWLRSDADNHRRILRHWARVLAPSCKEIVAKKRPFTWFVSILRMYYWYKPTENGMAVNPKRVRGETLNVSECREYILTAAHIVARIKFNDTDLRCLISHILTCSDHLQSVDLLMFLKTLIAEQKQLLLNVKSSMGLIAMFQYLFNIRNESVICATLYTIIDAHRADLIEKFCLNTHFDIILHQLTADFVSKGLLTRLIDITDKCAPELFPVCSWMAMNIGNKAMRLLLTRLTPSSRLATNEFWAVWAVVALYKADEKLQRFISRFLVKCSSNRFAVLFATVDVVGRALGEYPETIKCIIVTEFGRLLLRDDYHPTMDDVVGYFDLLRHFMFFRGNRQTSEVLQAVVNKSPFGEKERTRPKVRNPVRSPRRSPKKEAKRKARHSIHRNSLMPMEANENRYSPALAEQAFSFLNPEHPSNENPRKQSFRSKRTSLMVLDQKSFEYEPRPSIDIKIVSMMPCELDDTINDIAREEFSFKFGLRLNSSVEWQDQALAEQSLEVFKKYPDTRCAETTMLICSFLLHYNHDLVQSVLPKINIHSSSLSKVLALFRHHAEMTGFNIRRSSSAGSEFEAFECLTNIETATDKSISAGPLRFLKHLLKWQEKNSAVAFDIFALINNDIISLASDFMAEYSDRNGEVTTTSSKRWSQCWHHLTIDHAPWHKSLPASSIHEVHFKRDFTRCVSYCPVKLRRNFHFEDHLKASLIRDTGNHVSAQQCMDKYRAELAAQYADNAPPALFEVIEDKERAQHSSSYPISQCIVELPCEIITVSRVKQSRFSLLTDAIILTKSETRTTVINLNEIVDVFLRTRFHHPTAVELFLQSGKSYLINFPNIKAIPILKSLRALQLPRIRHLQCEDFKSYFASTRCTEDWMNRRMSNFDYLMNLNIASGRTFNDPSQYPILPWVISDYTSARLDLTDRSVYRDLTKPIGATNPERIKALKEKAKQFTKMGLPSYLYSSGYVCPLSVYLWLIREEPFTSLHIDIQSGRFDHAARQFSSITNAFTLSSTNQNDFRELIPEFFTTPEFLVNRNHFDLGKVRGNSIDNVALPPWAQTPYDFIYLQRKALESEYVSTHIQSWIDLVWGEKQRGEKAKQFDNVFMPQMYDDIWTQQNLRDPTERAEIEAILCHVGQIPPQLFDRPHPRRMVRRASADDVVQHSISVKLQTAQVIAASIKIDSDKRIRVSVIDAAGLCVVAVYYLSQISKMVRSGMPSRGSRLLQTTQNFYNRVEGLFKSDSSSPEFILHNENTVTAKTVRQFMQIRPLNSSKKTVVCSLADDSFIMVGATPTEIFKIRSTAAASEFMLRQKSDITCLASEGDWIVTANRDAVLSVYKQKNLKQPVISIPSFTNQIQCCAISEDFHSIVCGMRNGSLLLCSLTDGDIVRIIDLDGCRPCSILVTKGWGFIAVYMTKIEGGRLTHHIALYSVNGDVIRIVEIKSAVASWSTYKTFDGFDYIVMADDAANLYHFEAYFLDIGQPFHSAGDRVIATSFVEEGSLAIAVTDKGKLLFIPVSQ